MIEYDIEDDDPAFDELKHKLAEWFKKRKQSATVSDIKKKFGDRYLWDALQSLATQHLIEDVGGVTLSKWKWLGGSKADPPKLCVNCRKESPTSAFYDHKQDKFQPLCKTCRQVRQSRRRSVAKGK